MKTIKTFLPQFTGFYSTLFEDIIDSEVDYILEEEETYTTDNVEFDYKTFKEDISKQCVGVFEDAFNRDMHTKLSVSFESLFSPKFYNFENDSINVAISLSQDDFDTIIATIKENKTDSLEPWEGQSEKSPNNNIPHSPSISEQLFFIPEANFHRKNKENLQSRLQNAKFIGGFLNKYLLFEENHSLLLIDQHAAAERVNYEKFLNQILSL